MSDGASMSQPARAWASDWRISHFDRLVIHDMIVAQQPVMAMGGEGVERHVAHHPQPRHLALQGRDTAADQIVFVPGLVARGTLAGRIGRGKERDGRNPELPGGTGGVDQLRQTQAVDAGHGGDRRGTILIVDEDRPDQIGAGQHMFGDQAPGPVIAAVAPKAGAGRGPESRTGHGNLPSGYGPVRPRSGA